jgi:hypothetical protein
MAFGVQPPKTWQTLAGNMPVPENVTADLCEMLKIPMFVPLCG